MGKHYVDNKELYRVLLEYKFERLEAEKNNKPKPPIPNYVGECLLQIANRLSYKPNFANYMFREEMVGDGIENCINYLNNFDPEKSKNPFAYFTQIIYYAFIRRIQKEKKQTSIKQRLILKSGLDELVRQEGDNTDYQNAYADFLRKNMVVDVEPEKKEVKTKTKKRKTNISKLEYFM